MARSSSSPKTAARSAITGQFVTAATAAQQPRTTVVSTTSSHATNTVHRSAITGRFVTAATAARHPRTTITQNG